MQQTFKAKLIWAGVGLAFFAIYILIKLPDIVGRRESELKESREVTVTIPEGLSVKQIAEILESARLFSKDEFIKIAQKEEGYLFPDTYRFYKDAKPEGIVAKMKENFNKKVEREVLEEIANSVVAGQKRQLGETIIMASILEEEVKSTEDRKIVAGILWKRLDRGMGLNVDAALTYILGRASHDLTIDDLKFDSPYNTYRYRGLPPTPISNPGLDAILAAASSTPSKYFYYLTDKEGAVHYAKTLEEHALNKFKYLR